MLHSPITISPLKPLHILFLDLFSIHVYVCAWVYLQDVMLISMIFVSRQESCLPFPSIFLRTKHKLVVCIFSSTLNLLGLIFFTLGHSAKESRIIYLNVSHWKEIGLQTHSAARNRTKCPFQLD